MKNILLFKNLELWSNSVENIKYDMNLDGFRSDRTRIATSLIATRFAEMAINSSDDESRVSSFTSIFRRLARACLAPIQIESI